MMRIRVDQFDRLAIGGIFGAFSLVVVLDSPVKIGGYSRV
jgi:hypothetical protein